MSFDFWVTRARFEPAILHLERVVGHPSGGVAWGRHKFKIGLQTGVGVAVRRGRSPGLLPTLLPSTALQGVAR